jgi:hypothetical protein
LQRNPAALFRRSRKITAIPQLLLSNRTGESVLLNAAGRLCGLFLQSAEAQFGFDYSKGECNAITNRWFGESDLTLPALEAW